MSEISEKRVEALASNILECHDVKPSEVKALAGLALPALRDRAEPVQVPERPPERLLPKSTSVDATYRRAGIVQGWELCRAAILDAGALRERAEPVTVPDELPEFAPADVLKRYFNWTDDGDAEVFSMGWNACRAAMLDAGAPPAPVAAGWIACSDRLPEDEAGVLVATEFDGPGDWRMKWGTRVPGHPDEKNGWLIPGASWTPSHWMPLPAAPVKN